MKKLFFLLACVAMSVLSFGQDNQLVWANGRLLYGAPIESIDSLTYDEMEDVDTLHLLLPRTLIKVVHDTVYIHDTVCIHDTNLFLLYKRYDLDNEADAEEAISILGLSSISNEELIENYKYTKVNSGEVIGGKGFYIIFSDYNVIIEDPLTFANILDSAFWEKVQIGGKTAIYGEFESNVKYKCKISK